MNINARSMIARHSWVSMFLFASVIAWLAAIGMLGQPPSPFEPPKGWPSIKTPNSSSYDFVHDLTTSISCPVYVPNNPGCFEPQGFSIHVKIGPLPYVSEIEAERRRVVFLAEIEAWPIAAALVGLVWLAFGKKRRSQVGRIGAA